MISEGKIIEQQPLVDNNVANSSSNNNIMKAISFWSTKCGIFVGVCASLVVCLALGVIYHVHDVGMVQFSFSRRMQMMNIDVPQEKICSANWMNNGVAWEEEVEANDRKHLALPVEKPYKHEVFRYDTSPMSHNEGISLAQINELEILEKRIHPHHRESASAGKFSLSPHGFPLTSHDKRQQNLHNSGVNATTITENLNQLEANAEMGVEVDLELDEFFQHTHDAHSPGHTYIVLQHGLFGRPGELCNLGRAIQSMQIGTVLYSTANHPHQLTFDGVRAGGTRLAEWIKEKIPPKSDLVLGGHSLGGVYARYAVWKLMDEGWFKTHPARFRGMLSVASPQIGCHHPNQNSLSRSYQWAAQAFSQTAVDLHYSSTSPLEALTHESAVSAMMGRNDKFHAAQGKPFILAYGSTSDREVAPEAALMTGSLDPATIELAKTQPNVPTRHPMSCGRVTNLETWRKRWIRSLGVLDIERYLIYYPPGTDGHISIIEHVPFDAGHKGRPAVYQMAHRIKELLSQKMMSWHRFERWVPGNLAERPPMSHFDHRDSCENIPLDMMNTLELNGGADDDEEDADWKFFI